MQFLFNIFGYPKRQGEEELKKMLRVMADGFQMHSDLIRQRSTGQFPYFPQRQYNSAIASYLDRLPILEGSNLPQHKRDSLIISTSNKSENRSINNSYISSMVANASSGILSKFNSASLRSFPNVKASVVLGKVLITPKLNGNAENTEEQNVQQVAGILRNMWSQNDLLYAFLINQDVLRQNGEQNNTLLLRESAIMDTIVKTKTLVFRSVVNWLEQNRNVTENPLWTRADEFVMADIMSSLCLVQNSDKMLREVVYSGRQLTEMVSGWLTKNKDSIFSAAQQVDFRQLQAYYSESVGLDWQTANEVLEQAWQNNNMITRDDVTNQTEVGNPEANNDVEIPVELAEQVSANQGQKEEGESDNENTSESQEITDNKSELGDKKRNIIAEPVKKEEKNKEQDDIAGELKTEDENKGAGKDTTNSVVSVKDVNSDLAKNIKDKISESNSNEKSKNTVKAITIPLIVLGGLALIAAAIFLPPLAAIIGLPIIKLGIAIGGVVGGAALLTGSSTGLGLKVRDTNNNQKRIEASIRSGIQDAIGEKDESEKDSLIEKLRQNEEIDKFFDKHPHCLPKAEKVRG